MALVLSVFAAVLAALLFAVASALQHCSSAAAPRTSGLGMWAHLVRSRAWLLGTAAGLGGFGLHVLALQGAPLAVIQSVLVTGVLFALPLGRARSGRRGTRDEHLACACVVVGLVTCLLAAHPSTGASTADPGALLMSTVVATSVVACIVVAARRQHRAALLGTAAGICFGVTAALLKQIGAHLWGAPTQLMGTWPVYALVGVGALGLTLEQSAFQAGSLSRSLPALTVIDPLVGAGLGAYAFGERPATGPLLVCLQLVGVLLTVWGVLWLATHDEDPAVVALLTASSPR